jgi:hypothetical protein
LLGGGQVGVGYGASDGDPGGPRPIARRCRLLVAAVVPLMQVAGVGAMAVVTLGAAVLVRGLAPPRPAPLSPAGAQAAPHQRLWSPSFALWLGIGLAAAQTIGLAEVSALPIANELGGGTPTAVLLQVVLAVASATTGLFYGARSHWLPGSALQRAVTLLLGLSVGVVMLAVQAGYAVTVAGYVVVGACTAPLITTVLITIQNLVPAGRAAEAYGMNTASTGVGYALAGAALATLPLQVSLCSSLIGTGACVAAATLVCRSAQQR